MKPFFFLIILCLLSTKVFSQNIDSLELSIQKSEFRNLQNTVSELSKKLEIYENNSIYFGNMLDEQTNRFSLIIGSLIGMIGLITFISYKIEIVRLKKDYSKKISNVESLLTDFKKEYKKTENSLNLALANISRMHAIEAKQKNDKYYMFVSFLRSLDFGLKSNDLNDIEKFKLTKDYKNVHNYCKNLPKYFDEINFDEDKKALLLEDKERILKVLDSLDNVSQLEEIQYLAATIRIKVMDVLKSSS